MKKMYNHGYDMGFSVISNSPTTEGVTKEELIRGLERRIAMLKASPDELEQAIEPFDAAFEPEDEEEEGWFRNSYSCSCGEEGEDEWSCACNDKCPSCGREIQPSESIELDPITGEQIN